MKRNTFLSLTLIITFSTAVLAEDWPQWRGPKRDAISTEKGLLKAWPKDGPKLLWDSKKVSGGRSVGTGSSSMTIVGGKLYTMGDYIENNPIEVKKDDKVTKKNVFSGDEFVFCLDTETGKELWKTRLDKFYQNGNDSGARCTPAIDGPRMYVLSPHGLLACLETSTGSILWEKSLTKEFAGRMPGWGYSESPTIDGDKVIVSPGGKKAAIVALDKATGATIWTCELPKDSGSGNGYASFAIAEVGGIRQYITTLGKDYGLVGVDAKTGKLLWNYNKAANGTANIPTAIVKDDYVFTSTAYGAGAALLQLKPDGKGGIDAEQVWFLTPAKLQNHHGGVVMLGDYIYGGHGQNEGRPFCLEWKTGTFKWGPEEKRPGGSAAVLFADGLLYFRYQSGAVNLVDASPDAYAVKSSFNVSIAPNNWAHPVIWNGRLFLRGDDKILCYDLRGK